MAAKENDAFIEQILLKKLEPLDTPKGINARCAKTGDTALIFAAASGDVLVVKRLLERGADPTLRNLDDATAFAIAIYCKQLEIVQMLLQYETTQSLNYVDCRGDTALALAARLEWVTVEESIMAKGGVIPQFKMETFRTPSQMRTSFLKSLQRGGPLLLDNSSFPKAMLANCFVDNKSADFHIDYLEYLSLNPDLRRLMALVTQVSGPDRSKQFFFNVKYNKAMLFSGNAKRSENSGGTFNVETKDIYCFYKDVISIEILISFFHEAMHLAMDFIYENNASPYAREDFKQEQKFDEVLRETKTKLSNMRPEKMSIWEKSAYYRLCSVYTTYLENERAGELIAKIPETLICMGIHRGMAWLEQFKALMTYYRNVVVPDMQDKCKNVAYEEKQVPLTPFTIIMQLIYERKVCFYTEIIDVEAMRNFERLTVDELTKVKEMALFFEYEPSLVNEFAAYVLYIKARKLSISAQWTNRINLSVAVLEGLAKELIQLKGDHNLIETFKLYLKNRRELDRLYLDPNNKTHLDYWSRQVTWPGGCDYKERRVPHTIANLFRMLEQKSLIETPPDELKEEIHRIRKQSSGSRMGFFAITNMRTPIVEQLKTMSDDDFELSFFPGSSYSM